MIYIVFILCIVIFGSVTADPIDYSDCGSDYKIREVDIEGCTAIPCKLQIGKRYNITISLNPSYTSHNLEQEVYITLFNSVDVPVNVLPNNPCASLVCPVQVNAVTRFSATLEIGNNLVPAKGKLWWKMTADYGSSAVCMKTSVIVEPRKYNYNFLRPAIIPAI